MMTPQQMEAKILSLEGLVMSLANSELKRQEREKTALQEENRRLQVGSAQFNSPTEGEDENAAEIKQLVANYNASVAVPGRFIVRRR